MILRLLYLIILFVVDSALGFVLRYNHVPFTPLNLILVALAIGAWTVILMSACESRLKSRAQKKLDAGR